MESISNADAAMIKFLSDNLPVINEHQQIPVFMITMDLKTNKAALYLADGISEEMAKKVMREIGFDNSIRIIS